jgi:hypothetical protein
MPTKTRLSNLTDEEKPTILLPVRVTAKEHKLIKKAAKIAGDRYMVHYARRVIAEAARKETK